MNIVVSNVKGGVGKTTTAVYLAAVAAHRGRGPILLVDADPQGSTAEWYETDPFEGVELIEGPSVRTVTKAMNQEDGIVVVDTPPGEGNVVQAALARADAVVIPTRAGGVEPNRVVTTLEMTPRNIPAGVVICSARLGTNDLEATIEWWTELKVPVWGIVPERVSIASGPAAGLSSEGLEHYGKVLKKATTKASLTGSARRAQRASRLQLGVEPAVGPGHGGLPVQLADQLGEEPAAHGHAGRRRGSVRSRCGEPELVGLVEHGVVELAGNHGGLRAARGSSRRTRRCCRPRACHISSMPGPRPLKRVPISDTSTESRSGSAGAFGELSGPLLHEAELAEQRLVFLAGLLQQRHRNPDEADRDVGRLVGLAGETRAG